MPFFSGDQAPASPRYVLRELLYVYQLVLTLLVAARKVSTRPRSITELQLARWVSLTSACWSHPAFSWRSLLNLGLSTGRGRMAAGRAILCSCSTCPAKAKLRHSSGTHGSYRTGRILRDEAEFVCGKLMVQCCLKLGCAATRVGANWEVPYGTVALITV